MLTGLLSGAVSITSAMKSHHCLLCLIVLPEGLLCPVTLYHDRKRPAAITALSDLTYFHFHIILRNGIPCAMKRREKVMSAITSIHEKYMKEALKQAKRAYALGEVPIGCVIVHEGKIIGRGYNRRNTDKSTLAHAEITAIRKAGRIIGDWRLEDCTIYITLEPCQMCAGAIIQARIPEVVMGCMNPKAGCGGSVLNILEDPRFNHQASVTRGVLEQECSGLLKLFFTELRMRNNLEKRRARENMSPQESPPDTSA